MALQVRRLRSIIHSALTVERDHGHVRLLLRQESVDRLGQPIPWYTYPAIAWLENIDFCDLEVFEFGSGNNTKFWAKNARSVTSVETTLMARPRERHPGPRTRRVRSSRNGRAM